MTNRVALRIPLSVVGLLAIVGIGQITTARADGLDPIAMRQVGMDLVAGNFAFIKSTVGAKGDVKALQDPAKAVARWGKTIPVVFPPGSDKGDDTKALPEIWSDRAGFEKSAADMAEAATKLADAAKAGDADVVAAQTKVLGESCGGCHRHYRAR